MHRDLPRILELPAQFATDPLTADTIMRLTDHESGGALSATVLRRRDSVDTAWRMLTALGA